MSPAWRGHIPLGPTRDEEFQAWWASLTPAQQYAQAEAQRLQRDRQSRESAERDLMVERSKQECRDRAQAAVARLMAAGGVGLVPRTGIKLRDRPALLSRRIVELKVELEPVWPLGPCGWNFRKDVTNVVATGYTPTGRVVPMTRPDGRGLFESDEICCRIVNSGDVPAARHFSDLSQRTPSVYLGTIAETLERLVEKLT